MFKHNKNNRFGKRLEDGLAAHKADHQAWSRRQFLGNTGLMAAGGALLSSSPFSWAAPLFSSLYDNPDNDRVLILIRLFGGNDGLNTIVPFGDNARRLQYETIRPSIMIDENEAYSLTTDGMNPPEFALPELFKGDGTEETGLYDMWNEGNMAVIHNVGYPNSSTSHFKGSDLWASGAINNVGQNASVNDGRKYSGWLGRYFSNQMPAFFGAPPIVPPAIQIGNANNLIFKGLAGNPFDLVFTKPESFYNLISNEELYNTTLNDFNDNCIADIERVFIRQTTNNAFRYADSVRTAWNSVGNNNGTNYDSNLEQQLAIVERLIRGRLGTKVYQVSLGGFDTHRAQQDYHPELLQTLSTAIKATFTRLGQDADRVMMMTFSEFGRQVTENGSEGTDHGTLAPIMLFGNKVNGRNLYGTPIDLSPEKINGGMVDFDTQEGAIDFRSVYDKVLRDWLCADAETSDTVLHPTEESIINQEGTAYRACSTEGSLNCQDPLGGMIRGGCNSTVSESSTLEGYIASQVVFGYNIVKNNGNTSIELKYETAITGNIRLEILTSQGNSITYTDDETDEEKELLLEERYLEIGQYIHTFDATERLNDALNNTDRYIARFSINGVSIDRNFKIN